MKKSIGEIVFNYFNIAFMILLCIVTLYPYINQIAISLNDGADTMFGGITLFPRSFTWENYISVFSNSSFSRSIMNSVFRVVLGTILGLLVTTGAAYALTKKSLPGRNTFLTILIIPMFISGGLIPLFILYRYLHLINNIMVYIFPMAFSFFYMIVVRTYLQTLPISMEESAVIDGANDIQILFKIVLPLCMPVIATVALWMAVGHWNDWITSLYFVSKKELFTLQFVMYKVVKEAELISQIVMEQTMRGQSGGNNTYIVRVTPESIKSATLIVATLPIVVLYPFLQKYFVKGVMIGAIKG